MTENPGLLAAVLTVASVVLLSLLTLLCLRCKKKSKVIHEEPQIYNPQTFQRGGSQFAVMRSKTVTKTNQIPSAAAPGPEERPEDEEQGDYINITDCGGPVVCGSLERDYVDPLPISVYENEKTIHNTADADQTPGLYGNVFPSMSVAVDDDDYENSDFLCHVGIPDAEAAEQRSLERWQCMDADEPDYVNENGE